MATQRFKERTNNGLRGEPRVRRPQFTERPDQESKVRYSERATDGPPARPEIRHQDRTRGLFAATSARFGWFEGSARFSLKSRAGSMFQCERDPADASRCFRGIASWLLL